MATLIDTSVLIAVERGAINLAEVLGREPEESVVLAAISASELLHGVHRAKTARQRRAREAFVERILATVPVIPFDLTVARTHASLWAELAASGVAVGAHDLQIAATAVAHDHRVATRDRRSFPKIPNLRVALW